MGKNSLRDNNRLRVRSGEVEHNNLFVSFFYELMRDHLTPGAVEKLVRSVLDGGKDVTYTNGWLASYSIDIVERLWPASEQPNFAKLITALSDQGCIPVPAIADVMGTSVERVERILSVARLFAQAGAE